MSPSLEMRYSFIWLFVVNFIVLMVILLFISVLC